MAVIHRYNPAHKPLVTLTLAGINVAIAIADAISGEMLSRIGWARAIDIQYGEPWRLFTSGWLHSDWMHIAFNAYGIYVLGSIIERMHGWKPLLAVYMISLVGGAALAVAFQDGNAYARGASGAAYGLFGAVLGFFYVRAGSIRSIWEIPLGRQLLIWLGFGVYMSLRPGISLLGHLGGFVPGAFLGVFFEHQYLRSLELYHRFGIGVLLAIVVGLSVFACFPFTRASPYAVQALRAYERGELERGDELVTTAEQRRVDEGALMLLTHLRLWREDNQRTSPEFGIEELRMPLTHPHGIIFRGTRSPELPFSFLKERRTGTTLESMPQQP